MNMKSKKTMLTAAVLVTLSSSTVYAATPGTVDSQELFHAHQLVTDPEKKAAVEESATEDHYEASISAQKKASVTSSPVSSQVKAAQPARLRWESVDARLAARNSDPSFSLSAQKPKPVIITAEDIRREEKLAAKEGRPVKELVGDVNMNRPVPPPRPKRPVLPTEQNPASETDAVMYPDMQQLPANTTPQGYGQHSAGSGGMYVPASPAGEQHSAAVQGSSNTPRMQTTVPAAQERVQVTAPTSQGYGQNSAGVGGMYVPAPPVGEQHSAAVQGSGNTPRMQTTIPEAQERVQVTAPTSQGYGQNSAGVGGMYVPAPPVGEQHSAAVQGSGNTPRMQTTIPEAQERVQVTAPTSQGYSAQQGTEHGVLPDTSVSYIRQQEMGSAGRNSVAAPASVASAAATQQQPPARPHYAQLPQDAFSLSPSAEDGAAATQPERFESLDSVSKERPAVAPVRDRTPVAEHSVRPDGVPALDTRQSVQNTGDDLAGISDEVRRHILAGQLAMEVQLQRDPSVAGMRAIAKVLHDNTTLTHLQKIDFLIGFGRALHQSGLPRQQEALLIRAIAEAF